MTDKLTRVKLSDKLSRIEVGASALIREHGPEAVAVAEIMARAMIPGASSLVSAVEAALSYAADEERGLNQNEGDAVMTQLLEELGADITMLESLLDHFVNGLNPIFTLMIKSAQQSVQPEQLERIINVALEMEHMEYRALRDELRARTPGLETVQRQGESMLRQQAMEGDILRQVQMSASLSGEGVTSEDAESRAQAALERAERTVREAIARVEEESARAERISKLNAQREVLELITRHLNGELDASALHSALEGCMREGSLTRGDLPDLARAHLRTPRSAGDVVTSLVKGVEFKMVYCPAGEFWMGSEYGVGYEEERPRHRVEITNPFLIGQTQVTQAQWSAIMESDPSHFKGASLPVEQVNWFDCVRFCNALSESAGLEPVYDIELNNTPNVSLNVDRTGYRLPTEAEWEYMSKAGAELTYAGSNYVDEVAWYGWIFHDGTVTDRKTHPVAQKKPNAWGIYDCSGNVLEWCSDKWNNTVYQGRTSTVRDPHEWIGSAAPRVYRGGSWAYDARKCRVAHRYGTDDVRRWDNLGFRILRCV